MLSMVNVQQRYRTLEDRCRRGSLPLKKRRLLVPEDEEDQQDLDLKRLVVSNGTDTNKLSALTIVAAAASSSFASSELPTSDTASVTSSVASNLLKSTNHASEDHGSTPSGRRVLRPPLATPLPGGCHGRTSRNNSYCRRQPCYNGSKYCKLHYQHYIVAGIRTPLDEETESLQCELTTAIGPSAPQAREQLSSSHQQHQDKRFMGGSEETRCLATTTRGRPCSYVSVNDTKYCYLHADYDTNPPPRRGGGTRTADLNAHTLRSLDAGAAPLSHGTPASVSSEASVSSSRSQATAAKVPSTPKASRRGGPSKLAERHADSPWPLLSMISTDQWKGKSVKVATGPLKGRLGSVEKWGNGWVSIRLPNVGLHNRRSFELYLESNNANTDSPPAEADTATDTGSAPVVRDAEPQEDQSPGDLQCSKGSDVETDHESSTDNSVVVPATPRPTGAGASSYETPKTTSSVVGLTRVGNESSFPPEVTPLSTRPARHATDLPLSLMLEGPDRSPLLFGTAALERGRRTIHRPARYDETVNKSKKRGSI